MPDLSSSSRKALLELARKSIESHFSPSPFPLPQGREGKSFFPPLPLGEGQGEGMPAELNLKRGCFVTLYKLNKLRGCVGTFDATQPLSENVIRIAASSAFQDTRFPSVEKSELGLLKIHISVLGELKKMSSIEELEIGRHGVLVRYGSESGTYLPEVAVEMKWSVPEFITRCAREKAGLTPSEIASAEVFLYEVEKFSE